MQLQLLIISMIALIKQTNDEMCIDKEKKSFAILFKRGPLVTGSYGAELPRSFITFSFLNQPNFTLPPNFKLCPIYLNFSKECGHFD